ncbi:Nuclear cap-binding protein subunit 1 [Sphaceloma murrayae]|uniref:Nuclear cap-binding protein subunit 1 n=1 Tax=Sphaceloma murrayae TaxID=2082308 RepID=A0A2K1QKV2_9PEZI|nr:Nuclear cap-binding protein subunit 1 [Sphaceloma murrayae]
MAFLPPYTDTVVFLDNYHRNFGGPGVDLQTGAHSQEPYLEADGKTFVFGVEYSWKTNALRKLNPVSNTFCSSGAFFPDGTLVNPSGAETYAGDTDASVIQDGRQALRYYAPGPCEGAYGACTQDFDDQVNVLQSRRWYPTAQTLTNGDVVVVGGSDVGLLVTNEASINVPSYEIIKADKSAPPPQVDFDLLKFDESENQNANKSYNLYPILHLLPNANGANHVFTLAGNQAIIHDFQTNTEIARLPDVPLEPRTFPSSATVALLPLVAPNYDPEVLLCGGSSSDVPNPQALADCYTIKPLSQTPQWTQTDSLPNGPQTMTDAVLLPDGTTLLLNGAHAGSAGGYMATDPVFQPLIYNASAPAGQKFTKQPSTTIPRLYHSIAILLPSGQVLVAGSNPDVFYAAKGNPSINNVYPEFFNNGHKSFLHQQQGKDEDHPTEYRVEIFSPSYMDAPTRPVIKRLPNQVRFGQEFQIAAEGLAGDVKVRMANAGFVTHAVGMGQRMVELETRMENGTVIVKGPRDGSVMPPGVYLLFVVVDEVPSEGQWVKVE